MVLLKANYIVILLINTSLIILEYFAFFLGLANKERMRINGNTHTTTKKRFLLTEF